MKCSKSYKKTHTITTSVNFTACMQELTSAIHKRKEILHTEDEGKRNNGTKANNDIMHKSVVQGLKESKDENVDNEKANVQQQIYVRGDSIVRGIVGKGRSTKNNAKIPFHS